MLVLNDKDVKFKEYTSHLRKEVLDELNIEGVLFEKYYEDNLIDCNPLDDECDHVDYGDRFEPGENPPNNFVLMN